MPMTSEAKNIASRASNRSTRGLPPPKYSDFVMNMAPIQHSPNKNQRIEGQPVQTAPLENATATSQELIDLSSQESGGQSNAQQVGNQTVDVETLSQSVAQMRNDFEIRISQLQNFIVEQFSQIKLSQPSTNNSEVSVQPQPPVNRPNEINLLLDPHLNNQDTQRNPSSQATVAQVNGPTFVQSYVVPPSATAPQLHNHMLEQAHWPLSIVTSEKLSAKKIYPLPTFSGEPEEWQAFLESFESTTTEFEYSNVHNIMRLRSSLTGRARESVEALLSSSANVADIMNILRETYGRPEQLIKNQINKIRFIPPVPENDPESLVAFANKINNMAIFLKNAGGSHHLGNPMLLSELVMKLPNSRQMQWAEESVKLCQPVTILDFSNWLVRIRKLANIVLDFMPSNASHFSQSSIKLRNAKKPINDRPRGFVNLSTGPRECYICESGCPDLDECNQFKNLDNNVKWEKVKSLRLCFTCLKPGHQSLSCYNKKRCDVRGCIRYHHKLLHDDLSNPSGEVNANYNCHASSSSSVLFPILPVKLYGPGGVYEVYAFVDDGASVTIIEEELLQLLNINGKESSLELQWLNKHTSCIKSRVVDLQISGTDNNAKIYNMSNVHSAVNLSLPVQSFSFNDHDHLRGLPVHEYCSVQPKIIISLAHAYLTVPISRPHTTNFSGPIASQTRLGWIVYGPSKNRPLKHNRIFFTNVVCNEKDLEINDLMTKYFDMETFGVKPDMKPHMSNDDIRAIQTLEQTVKMRNGRYESGLLWKNESVNIGHFGSFEVALKRLVSLEKKMKSNAEYARLYKEKINSYLSKGYARRLEENKIDRNRKTFYLPHFGIMNPKKPGIRVVFDAAAPVNGISLNDNLLIGPDMNQPLIAVLFKFRQARIAVCGDIKEMFHQIIVREEDQDCQRFLWRDGDSSQPAGVYVMERLIFGAACSPAIAQFVKNVNADKFIEKHPRAVKGIKERHYVDDYADSFNTVEEAIRVIQEVIKIHQVAGFELRNIISNSKEIKEKFGDNNGEEMKCLESKLERILGMHWHSGSDEFAYVLNLSKISGKMSELEPIPTKRQLLSIAMSVFDPLGFLANILVTPKLLMQEVWKAGVQWDEQIPPKIFEKFKRWISEMPKIEMMKIPRCYMSSFESQPVDLHVFADASEVALGIVAYWRKKSGNFFEVAFVCGKSSCAPTRYHSVPKLELQAAVLAVRLKETIVKYHDKKIRNTVYWTDSKTVLRWITSDHRKYKQYVANRVSEILESSKIEEWKWCPGNLNPADSATRENMPSVCIKSSWLCGPEFLYAREEEWPNENPDVNNDEIDPELKQRHAILFIARDERLNEAIQNSSNFLKLKRIFAWIWRFYDNLKARKESCVIKLGPLECEELEKSERTLCRHVQMSYLSQDYENLKKNGVVGKESQISSLNPYIDCHGLIRCNGRIVNASGIDVSMKMPIILPTNHPFTDLVIMHYHVKYNHQFTATVMNEIRQKFWIPALRRRLRAVTSRCSQCKINRAKPIQPQMAPLPIDRVTPFIRPFSYTGIDFFGPVQVMIRRCREKRWVALFTCLTIRAVHLEIATDLSSDACILCIKNFVNRRGIPVQIRSDNGTNFVGIHKELSKTENYLDNGKINSALSSLGIKWIYNTPSNPSQGGAWERLVQSVKKTLYFTLKEHAPRLDTFNSLLIEAENIINSRPLTHLPVTPEEPEPLTPNHFLVGNLNSTQTPASYDPKLMCLRKQWKLLENLKNGWWKQWMRDYLPELTRRSKWCAPAMPVAVGSLVLICDPDISRSNWRRGRVVELFHGKDGVARSAVVKTADGFLNRPLSKLAVLDVESAESSESQPPVTINGGEGVVNAADLI